jgi:hypothetical protein
VKLVYSKSKTILRADRKKKKTATKKKENSPSPSFFFNPDLLLSQLPPQFLGLPANADSAAVSRAYNTLKRGPKRFDDQYMSQLEAAHGQIMMRQLSARLSGGAAAAAPDARFADRGTYFPWRPRRYEAESKHKMYTGAVFAALALSGIYSPSAGTQPVVAAAVVGTIANILKLNTIFPPASSPEASPEAKAQGAKNIGRAMILSVIATFVGCALLFSVPDSVASLFGRSLPVVFYEGEKALLAIGSCAANWVMTSYFR